MIPSLNDPKIMAEHFRPTDGKWPSWDCDCCQKFYSEKDYLWGQTMPDTYLVIPVFVEVKGIKYFGCSRECAKILFNIHHQYAMREPDPTKRYAKLWTPGEPEKQDFLDLDTVARIAIEEHVPNPQFMTEPTAPGPADWVFLTWWTSGSPHKVQFGILRSYATEVIELWKSRPALVRAGGPV